MGKPCVKFYWKVLGTNINIEILRQLPLQSMLNFNR